MFLVRTYFIIVFLSLGTNLLWGFRLDWISIPHRKFQQVKFIFMIFSTLCCYHCSWKLLLSCVPTGLKELPKIAESAKMTCTVKTRESRSQELWAWTFILAKLSFMVFVFNNVDKRFNAENYYVITFLISFLGGGRKWLVLFDR